MNSFTCFICFNSFEEAFDPVTSKLKKKKRGIITILHNSASISLKLSKMNSYYLLIL